MADARTSRHSSRSSDPFSFSLAMSARLRACVLVLGMAYTCLRADGAVSWDSFEVSMRYGGCPHAEWAACMCVATPRGEVCHSVADRHTQTTRLTTLNELVRDAGPCAALSQHGSQPQMVAVIARQPALSLGNDEAADCAHRCTRSRRPTTYRCTSG